MHYIALRPVWRKLSVAAVVFSAIAAHSPNIASAATTSSTAYKKPAVTISGPNSALGAAAFLSSLGVNTHTTYSNTVYANTALVVTDLAYLGFGRVRDGVTATWSDPRARGLQQLAADGYKINFAISQPSVATMAVLDSYATTYPQAMGSIEGPNEVNLMPISYNGGTALPNEIALQQAIYTTVHSDGNLAGIPVVNLTLGYPSVALYSTLGNMSAAADNGNAHIYQPYGLPPATDWNAVLSMSSLPTPGVPTVVTETGYFTLPSNVSGVDEPTQAKYSLNLIMDAALSGAAQTFFYELLDEFPDTAGTNAQAHYGLFHNNGTPKRAANAIHNLVGILGANSGSPAFKPNGFTYTTCNLPTKASQLVLGKQNGAYDIVFWAEPTLWNYTLHKAVAATTTTVTVNFPQTENQVSVFDALAGTSPVAYYAGVQTINVQVSDHPIVIEVGP